MAEVESTESDFINFLTFAMRRSLNSLKRYSRDRKLNFNAVSIMHRMYFFGELKVSDLCTRMEISAPAVSQILDKVLKTGYISCRENPEDRREKFCELTPSGREFLEESNRIQKRWMTDLYSALTAEEQNSVDEAMGILMNAIAEDEFTEHQPFKFEDNTSKENTQ